MGESRIGPGMISGDHHHGEAETGIYVVSAHPVFVFLDDDEERRVQAGPATTCTCRRSCPTARRTPRPTRLQLLSRVAGDS
jgi:hypothetical protein